MPYAVGTADSQPGLATYTLGGPEEWTLVAATFVVNMDNANDDDTVILDTRAPGGGIIARQIVDFIHFTSFYSLSALAEPMYLDTQAPAVEFPQGNSGVAALVTERLTPVTLTSSCVLNVYASLGAPTPGTDPISSLDVGVLIENLHLWVEDTNSLGRNLPGVGNPILLGVG